MEINTNIVFKCRELINALYLATKKLKVMGKLGFKRKEFLYEEL